VPPRKRKVTYPPPRSSRGPRPDPTAGPIVPRTTVAIDPTAGVGRKGLSIGGRVRIIGTGLYAGEAAVIERFAGSVIPAAVVRTESGRTRQVRTIDLEPIAPESPSKPAEPPAAEATATADAPEAQKA
jgi:hypothetical protein